MLELKHCPNVLFAGVDSPEDITGHTYQELFHTGGFVVSDNEVLETVTLGESRCGLSLGCANTRCRLPGFSAGLLMPSENLPWVSSAPALVGEILSPCLTFVDPIWIVGPGQGFQKHLSTVRAAEMVRGWSRGRTRMVSLEKGGQRGALVAVFSSLTGRGREKGGTLLLETRSDGTGGDRVALTLLDVRGKKSTANVFKHQDRIPISRPVKYPWRYSNLT